ncbi:MAG: DUF2849 domain-containing protein [Bauldia sp.]|nr:DUF2849 domain-containing protein [Bauldia sp.]
MFKAATEGQKKIVTVNRLIDGRVMFLGPGNRWVMHVTEAAVLDDGAELEAAMAFGRAEIAARQVTELYPIDVEVTPEGPVPVRLRERIRAEGPTVAYGEAERAPLTAGSR